MDKRVDGLIPTRHAPIMGFETGKGHAALRKGRFSAPQATYFVTLCTARRSKGLTKTETVNAFWDEIQSMQDDRTWKMRSAVIMPDHLHLLFVIGERLSMSSALQRLKAKTRHALSQANLEWERGFFDHRIRSGEAAQPIFRYIYLNPYRAKLISTAQEWEHYRCAEDDWAWFSTQLAANLPEPAWLK